MGHSRALWQLWMVQMTDLGVFLHAVYLQKMKDLSNVFKDAVDRLFQGPIAALNGSNDRPWCFLALTWHPILSWQLPTGVQAVYPNRWWLLQKYSKMQLTGYCRALRQLWIVQVTDLDVVLPINDIPFSVDNCQLACMLSTPNRWWILQMSSKMQLTGCSRAPWQLWMFQMTCLDVVLP